MRARSARGAARRSSRRRAATSDGPTVSKAGCLRTASEAAVALTPKQSMRDATRRDTVPARSSSESAPAPPLPDTRSQPASRASTVMPRESVAPSSASSRPSQTMLAWLRSSRLARSEATASSAGSFKLGSLAKRLKRSSNEYTAAAGPRRSPSRWYPAKLACNQLSVLPIVGSAAPGVAPRAPRSEGPSRRGSAHSATRLVLVFGRRAATGGRCGKGASMARCPCEVVRRGVRAKVYVIVVPSPSHRCERDEMQRVINQCVDKLRFC